MNWSIYAYIPFIWLAFVLIYGLTRAAYEVGIGEQKILPPEVGNLLCEYQERDFVKLSCGFKYSMFGIPLSNPNALWEAAAETIYPELIEKIKQHISFNHHPERDCFEGSIWIGRKRA